MSRRQQDSETLTTVGILSIGVAFLYALVRDETAALAEIQRGQYLEPHAATAFRQMEAAAAESGIRLNVVSSFRTREKQIELWNKALARYKTESAAVKWVSRPGTSKHELGLAVDIKLDPNVANDSNNVKVLETNETYKWLAKNASRFGFKRSPSEPWHWVYHGRR